MSQHYHPDAKMGGLEMGFMGFLVVGFLLFVGAGILAAIMGWV
jgi:hypothetical protein